MKYFFIVCFCAAAISLPAQELYVFSEPASNMPSRSLGIKQTAKILRNSFTGLTESRHTTEAMAGVSKNLMLHAATSFSDMYSSGQRWESARLYAKYRFLSNDEMFSHFRMAVFAEGAATRSKSVYDELSLDGDQSGIQLGVVATQLLHKLALSATVSRTDIFRWDKTVPQTRPSAAFNYSLSAGYLVLPKKYTSYNQTNLNLYVEMLGQQTTGISRYFVDLAPAAQLIFNSSIKLNAGYRFQLGSDMNRMSDRSWLVGLEWQFLNVL